MVRDISICTDAPLSEPSTSADSSALAPRTPGEPARRLTFASSVPLPPSPAVVADQIDRQTAKVRSSLAKVYNDSGIVESVDNFRDRISTTAFIQTAAIIIELAGLQEHVLPIKYLSMIPASETLGTPAIPLKVPDLFVMLTSDFWATSLLWLATSIVLPMAISYFFNLRLKAKSGGIRHAKDVHPSAQYDPLTFHLAKGLIAWLVYGKHLTLLGWPASETSAKIDYFMPGGYQGVLVASGIGAITRIYEVVLRK